jgi:hypothetical protein
MSGRSCIPQRALIDTRDLRHVRTPSVIGYAAVAASLAVDAWEHEGRKFEVVMASDVIRDGMGLELTELGSAESGPVLEAFWRDDGSGFDFITHSAGTLPFALVERFVAAARKHLPPTEGS